MRKVDRIGTYVFVALLLLALTPWEAHAAESSKFRKSEAVKAKELNRAVSDLCKSVGCFGSKPIYTGPIISTVGLPPLTQGQGVVISGKNFGDSPGTVILKGAFLVNGVSTTMSVDLPILSGYWTDTFIGTGPIPTNLIALDQDVLIQVKSASNVLSREQKAAFVSQREIKLLPSSAMKGTRYHHENTSIFQSTPSMVAGVTNTIGVVFEQISGVYQAANWFNDVWTAKLRDYQKFHTWVFGHWVGNFPTAPTFSIVNNDLTFSTTWSWEHTAYVSHTAADGFPVDDWVFNAGYWVNMYYTTPTGMD